jgi:hypothetical protein
VTTPALRKGLLIPRLSQANRLAMTAPAQGIIVYQTDGTSTGGAGTGFWYNQGTSAAPKWLRLTDSSGISYDPTTGLQVGPGPVAGPGPFSAGTPGGPTPTTYYPYRGSWEDMRVLFLYRASNLLAAGLHAGPITQMEFNVAAKSSTAPYMGYTIQIGQTAATTVPTAFPAAGTLTTVHTSNYTTTAGWNAHPFGAGTFTWDGTSNILVQICYNNSAATVSDLPYLVNVGYVAGFGVTDNGVTGCSMTTATNAGGDVAPNTSLPVTRFTQTAVSYTLPPVAGTAGQVLTQQFDGTVDFQDPQWTQNGTSLHTTIPASNVGIGLTAPANRFDLQLQARIGTHATGRAFYATGDVGAADTGFEFRHSNGTQGIGLGYNTIYAAGSNTDQDLNLLPKGTGIVGVSSEIHMQNASNVVRRSNRTLATTDQFDSGTLDGIHIANNEVEEGGFWANGNYAAIYSPGDNDLVKFMDEDFFNNAGTVYDNGAMKARIDGAGQYFQVSDALAKHDIKPIADGLRKLVSLSGYTYAFNLAPKEIEKGQQPLQAAGVLAQEVEKVLPEAVSQHAGHYMVNYAALTPLFIQAIKEQQAQLETLKAQNASLTTQVAAQQADHAALLALQAQLAQLQQALIAPVSR